MVKHIKVPQPFFFANLAVNPRFNAWPSMFNFLLYIFFSYNTCILHTANVEVEEIYLLSHSFKWWIICKKAFFLIWGSIFDA